jgi:hypothetical protein
MKKIVIFSLYWSKKIAKISEINLCRIIRTWSPDQMKRLVGVKTPMYVLFNEYFIEMKFSSVSLTRNCFGTPKQKYIPHSNRF